MSEFKRERIVSVPSFDVNQFFLKTSPVLYHFQMQRNENLTGSKKQTN